MERSELNGAPLNCLLVLCLFAAVPFFAQTAPPDGMVLIPAGEFWMGRVHMWLIDELEMYLRLRMDDQPAHIVNLDNYYIDKYEVTNADYARHAEAVKARKPFHWMAGKVPAGQEDYPVYNVSWDEAAAYCASAGKRLPTEAEWEKAARGGREKTLYPWGDELVPRPAGAGGGRGGGGAAAKLAQYGGASGPTKVGSYPPNGFGLFDMVGNVNEWVADFYKRTYYSVTREANPRGPESGPYRVIRGASWSETDERILAVHYRNYTDPGHRSNVIGFRCAR